MDVTFLVQGAYAGAVRDATAQELMVALRAWAHLSLDRMVASPADADIDADIGAADAAYAGGASLVVPVGGLGYARAFLAAERSSGRHPSADDSMEPLELPAPLVPFAGRRWALMRGRDIPDGILADGSRWFLKDAGQAKRWNSALHDSGGLAHLVARDDTPYVVSERVRVASEWRVFAHADEPLACQCYLGDPLAFPDAGAIREMIAEWAASAGPDGHPRAYTLDLMVTQDGRTLPLECHPLVSCGLYGFVDMALPTMLADGYRWYLSGRGRGAIAGRLADCV